LDITLWRKRYRTLVQEEFLKSVAEAQDRVRITPKVVAFDYANPPAGDGAEEEEKEDLAACIRRLRRLEATCAQSLERMLREGRVSEAQALRREHASIIKSLFDASSKLLKLEEARGKLVSLDTALSMISESLSEPVILLRQLPSVARDSAERDRLQSIVYGILDAMKEGARRGLERTARESSMRAS
jgi:hypothetical protein